MKLLSSPEQRQIKQERVRERACTYIVAINKELLGQRTGLGRRATEVDGVMEVRGSDIDQASKSFGCEARYRQVGEGVIEAICGKVSCPIAGREPLSETVQEPDTGYSNPLTDVL